MTSASIERPVLDAGEPMAEAVRKVLREQFDVMLANEAGSRVGDDIEHVHDMRVAVRRMRTALRLFGDYYRRGAIKRFQRPACWRRCPRPGRAWTARASGAAWPAIF